MKDRELRVGVIGAGAMGEAHLRAYARQPGLRIVGLTSRTPARARELAERYGVEETFVDAPTMIDATRPDGVSVTTGEHDHVAPATYALEHGVGVLLEKPIASTVVDAEQLAETARAADSLLVPAHILRFALPYRALRDEVRAGRIGQIVGIAARRDRSRLVADHYAHVHPAFLTAVHDIDLVLWLTGARGDRVRALERRSVADRGPDLIWAQIELDSGVLASVATTYLHPAVGPMQNSDRFEVYGTAGVADVDVSIPLVTVHGSPTSSPDWLIGPADGSGAFGDEIAHFLACIRYGRPSDVVSVDDAVEGIRIADAMVQSASAGGREISLRAEREIGTSRADY